MTECNKTKFFQKYRAVSQELEKCLDDLLLISATISSLEEDGDDEDSAESEEDDKPPDDKPPDDHSLTSNYKGNRLSSFHYSLHGKPCGTIMVLTRKILLVWG